MLALTGKLQEEGSGQLFLISPRRPVSLVAHKFRSLPFLRGPVWPLKQTSGKQASLPRSPGVRGSGELMLASSHLLASGWTWAALWPRPVRSDEALCCTGGAHSTLMVAASEIGGRGSNESSGGGAESKGGTASQRFEWVERFTGWPGNSG